MKNSILIIAALFIGLTATAQTALNKTVPVSNVEHIAVNGTQGEIYYSTDTDYMMYQCGDFNPTNLGSSVNDIITVGGANAVGNDTMCINYASANYYYGINNTVTDGTNTHDMFTPVNALASDGTNIYTIYKTAGSFAVFQINGSTANSLGAPFGPPNFLDNYSDLDYFELGGTSYIAIVYSSGLGLYDMSDNSFYFTLETDVTSVTATNNDIFFSKGNEIYELTAISPNSNNPQYKEVTTSLAYTIDANQTINEFAFDIWGDNINVAATDGVYSECTSTVSVEEQEVAFEETTLYPNPNNGNFTINNIDAGTNIKVISSTGQVVHSEVANYDTNINLNMSIPAGIYFVQVSNDSSNRTIKFIKQ